MHHFIAARLCCISGKRLDKCDKLSSGPQHLLTLALTSRRRALLMDPPGAHRPRGADGEPKRSSRLAERFRIDLPATPVLTVDAINVIKTQITSHRLSDKTTDPVSFPSTRSFASNETLELFNSIEVSPVFVRLRRECVALCAATVCVRRSRRVEAILRRHTRMIATTCCL